MIRMYKLKDGEVIHKDFALDEKIPKGWSDSPHKLTKKKAK